MSARIGRARFLYLALAALGIMLVIGVVPNAEAASKPGLSLQVTLSPDTIGLDGQAVLQVQVNGGTQSIPDLDMPSLPAFEVYSQGRSSNISIINGQVSASVSYTYVLMPQKAGVFPIDGIAIVVDNQRYVGNMVTLTVLNRGQATSPKLEQHASDAEGGTRDLFLVASVDKKNPYVNDQVTLSLKFYLGVQNYSSPELNEPTTTGFWAEPLGNGTPYMEKVKGRNYRVFEIKYALFPTQSGDLTIGRAAVSTTVASPTQRRDPFDMFGDLLTRGDQVTVRSEPVTLNVRPIPTAGKPADFSGTIGRYSIEAKADKTDAEVNEPVTVTIKITGQGNIKSVGEPAIPDLPDFRVYRASSNESMTKLQDKLGGTKGYEEVFIPKRAGLLEIPALSLSVFNPENSRYETITSRPISLNVKKPEGYVSSPDVPYSGPSTTLGNEAQDIRFIRSNLGTTQPVGRLVLFSPLYLFVNGLPLALLAGLVVARKRRERLATDIGYARSRGASRMAHKRLAKARSLARLESAREFYAELSLSLIAYVADKLNISPYGLTSDQVADLLRQKSGDEKLVADAVGFLHQCDFARFAPADLKAADLQSALGAAEDLMVRIEGVKFV